VEAASTIYSIHTVSTRLIINHNPLNIIETQTSFSLNKSHDILPNNMVYVGKDVGKKMPKKVKEMAAIELKRLSKPGLHAVGGVTGLHIRINSDGGKSWILRYSTGERRTGNSGKVFYARRDVGLGSYPEVTLARAREKAREVHDRLAEGVDPVQEKKAAKATMLAANLKQITFAEAAKRCHAKQTFTNVKHGKDWLSSLERFAFGEIGSLPVEAVELPHIMAVLSPIWETRTETATRVRQRIQSVLNWATVSGFRTGANPARWKGHLSELLKHPKMIKVKNHYATIDWRLVPAFMADLRQREGMAARALEFAILTAARSGEVRGATWNEIDFDAKVWTVPAERMKARKLHHVPLSDAALALLENLPRLSAFVFTAPRGGMLSDMALLQVTRRMRAECVPHGVARSSFKDWARNMAAYPDEASELALAHVSSDSTRSAYARDELLPMRAKLMADWADFLLS
jgi:integrase